MPVTFFCCFYCVTSAQIVQKPSAVSINFERLSHKYSAFTVYFKHVFTCCKVLCTVFYKV